MNAGRVLIVVAAIAGSLLCVRLGLWQWGRMERKHAANGELSRRMTAPPVALDAAPDGGRWPEGRVELRGRLLPGRHVLLRGRMDSGEPGVELVTPFQLAGDSTWILLDRGWLPAEDGATLAAERLPADADSLTTIVGLIRPFETGAAIPAMREIPLGDARAWSAPRLMRDSIANRLGKPLADVTLLQLPVDGDAALPRRHAPHVEGESMHLGYVIQWFAMALLIPLVAFFLLRRASSRPDSARG